MRPLLMTASACVSKDLEQKHLLSLIFSRTVEGEQGKSDILEATMSILEIVHHPEDPGSHRQQVKDKLEALFRSQE